MKGEITTYNKLVRDDVPTMLAGGGLSVSFRAIKGEELKEALKNKLLEEVYEFINAKTHDCQIEELADILTVIGAIEHHFDIGHSLVVNEMDVKAADRGYFDKGYYLETVTEVE